MLNPANWNLAQWFMVVIFSLQLLAAPAFWWSGQPVGALTWLLYGLAGIAWFFIAGGYK